MATPAVPVAAPRARDRATGDRWAVYTAAAVLVLAGLAVYANTFSAPFIFDDLPSIRDNSSLRDLQPGALLLPPSLGGAGAGGRPVVNLSLALNRVLGGDNVAGYHAFNLLVHLAAALALFGVIRRTLPLVRRAGEAADTPGLGLALAAALVWLVHPLQTESVTCVIQRTESLAGLFYLLTLYGFIRAVVPERAVGGLPAAERAAPRPGWLAVAFAACVFGAATKELMATAPLMVFLYDRTFVSGTFKAAWLRRRGFYAALALATWTIVAALVWRSGLRGGTVGFGHGVTAWEYFLTQVQAVVMYLKLAVWPHPLVLDYGTTVIRHIAAVWPQLVVLAGLGAATVWQIARGSWLGFLGGWFFAILAPSSSFVPLVTQTMAEHRMYLPLAALVVCGAVVVSRLPRWTAIGSVVLLGAALGVTTLARNHAYRSAEAIWTDTVAKRPDNARAHFTLAELADDAGRHDEAIAHDRVAVRLLPNDAAAHFDLAFSLEHAGRLEEAVTEYEAAARLRPASVDPDINLGPVLVKLGRIDEATIHAERVVAHRPDSGYDQFNLAEIYRAAGRVHDALPHYERAAALLRSADAFFALGNGYVATSRFDAAAAAFAEAIRLNPNHAGAHANLGGALVRLGRFADAVPEYERAARLLPENAQIAAALAYARRRAGVPAP